MPSPSNVATEPLNTTRGARVCLSASVRPYSSSGSPGYLRSYRDAGMTQLAAITKMADSFTAGTWYNFLHRVPRGGLYHRALASGPVSAQMFNTPGEALTVDVISAGSATYTRGWPITAVPGFTSCVGTYGSPTPGQWSCVFRLDWDFAWLPAGAAFSVYGVTDGMGDPKEWGYAMQLAAPAALSAGANYLTADNLGGDPDTGLSAWPVIAAPGWPSAHGPESIVSLSP